jgi:hypothetical protein
MSYSPDADSNSDFVAARYLKRFIQVEFAATPSCRGRATDGTSTRWSSGSPAGGCACSVPSTRKRGRPRPKRHEPALVDAKASGRRGTGSSMTHHRREMDSNHRFPVRFKHKDGARRRGSAVSSSQPVTGCTGRKRDANSAPPVRVDTSAETASHVRFRSPANRRCRR